MKKMYVSALVMAVVLAVTGCDLSGVHDTATGPSAPDMGSPSAIPASHGTIPNSEDGAKQLFVEAMAAIQASQTRSVASPTSKNILARGTQTETQSLDKTIPIGGGTIGVSGSVTRSYTEPDSIPDFKPNYTYNDLLKAYLNLDITYEITDVTLPEENNPTYTYNGKAVAKSQANMNQDVTTGATQSDYSFDIDVSIGIQAGYAVSVKRNSDGAGAKFILSYAFDYAKNNYLSNNYDDIETDLVSALHAKKATLKVYDDDNKLKYSIDLTLYEVNMIDPLTYAFYL